MVDSFQTISLQLSQTRFVPKNVVKHRLGTERLGTKCDHRTKPGANILKHVPPFAFMHRVTCFNVTFNTCILKCSTGNSGEKRTSEGSSAAFPTSDKVRLMQARTVLSRNFFTVRDF